MPRLIVNGSSKNGDFGRHFFFPERPLAIDMLELLALGCIALAWLIPNHYAPWTTFYNDGAAFCGLLLLVLSCRRRLWCERGPTAGRVVLLVGAIPFLQWALGILYYSGDAWVSTLYLAAFSAAIMTGSAWAASDARSSAARLCGTVLFGALVSSLIAVMQVLRRADWGIWLVEIGPGGLPVGNLGHWNVLASLIGVGAGSLLLLYERRRIPPLAASALLVVLLLGLGATQSRTALAFGPVVLGGMLLARRRSMVLRTPLLVVVLAIVLHWTLATGFASLQETLLLQAPLSIGTRGLSTPRWKMWGMLIDAATRAPWVGYGWLQVGAAELSVVNKFPPIEELWLQGHNILLELILWCGIPLGLLLGGTLVYWYVSRALRIRTLESLAAMLCLVILGVHSLLEFPFQFAYFLIPAGLWIGQIERAVAAPTGARAPSPQLWTALPVALALIVALGIAKDYPAIEEDFRLARFQGLRIGEPASRDTTPNAFFLSSLTGFLHAARIAPAPQMGDSTLAAIEASTKRYPYAVSLSRSAVALALNGRQAEARERFLSIRKMFGPAIYSRLKADLVETGAGGQSPALSELAGSLPLRD